MSRDDRPSKLGVLSKDTLASVLRETKTELKTQTKTSTPPPCPKSMSVIAVLYARNPYLVCAVHPTGSDTDTCPDFQENPNAEPEELWEP